MLYSCLDHQTGRYMCTGRNSITKEECIKEMIEYINSDCMGDDELIESPSEAILNELEFEIVEHDQAIEDEEYN